jgi:hypothetical protein
MNKVPVVSKSHSKNLGNVINANSVILDKSLPYKLAKRCLPLKTIFSWLGRIIPHSTISGHNLCTGKGFFPLRIMEYDDDWKHNCSYYYPITTTSLRTDMMMILMNASGGYFRGLHWIGNLVIQ